MNYNTMWINEKKKKKMHKEIRYFFITITINHFIISFWIKKKKNIKERKKIKGHLISIKKRP